MKSGYCPSCTCGWSKPLDAFDVTPPDTDCRNSECQCHRGFWMAIERETRLDLVADPMTELEKRRLWGDR